MASTVNKRSFLWAMICPAQGWYHHRDRSTPSLGAQLLLEEGNKVGRRAHALFPGGVKAHGASMVGRAEETARLMADADVPAIFEAAFVAGELSTKADVLVRLDDGWELIEVKSSINGKPEHTDDLAYTSMVMARAGTKIDRATLMIVSRDYRLGDDVSKLLVRDDRTADVKTQLRKFDELADALVAKIFQDDRPDVELIIACRKCPYFAQQCVGVGVEYPLFDIPRISEKKVEELKAQGIKSVVEIPSDFDLTATQASVREAISAGGPIIGPGLGDFLDGILWPAHYLDFETAKTAIPLYTGIAPHQEYPTQFSVHICSAPGEVTAHVRYLADGDVDPRPELAKRLVEAIGPKGSIVVYSSYEKTQINALAAACPELADELSALLPRLFDLEKAFKDHYKQPEFHGRTTIKMTLPAMVSEMSYDGMVVADGLDAMAVFAFMVWGKYSAEEHTEWRARMLEYCKQDTLAMVKLHEKLLEAVAASSEL